MALEARRDGHALARGHDEVIAGAPGEVVDQHLEGDRRGGVLDARGPEAGADAIHGDALVPAQARAGAAEEEVVAEADVDLGGDEGHGRLAGLLLGGSGGFDRGLGGFHGLGRSLGGGGRSGGLLGGLFHGDFLFQVKGGGPVFCPAPVDRNSNLSANLVTGLSHAGQGGSRPGKF